MSNIGFPVYPGPSSPSTFFLDSDSFVYHMPDFVTAWTDMAGRSPTGGFLTTTSVSSVAIGTGTKTFVLAANRAYLPGMRVMIANTAASQNFMFGEVISYTSGTLTLVVNVTCIGGSGTLAAWTISSSAKVAEIGGGNHRFRSTLNTNGSTNTYIPTATTIQESTGTAFMAATNATDGLSITINNSGYYFIQIAWNGVIDSNFGISSNSSQLSTSINSITATDVLLVGRNAVTSAGLNTVSSVVGLSVGDVIRPHSSSTSGPGNNSFMQVQSFGF